MDNKLKHLKTFEGFSYGDGYTSTTTGDNVSKEKESD